MTNSHIFISYSRQDKFFVEFLLNEFTLKLDDKFNFWYDIHDIGAGEKWKPAIDFALDNAIAVVVVCSPDSMKSHQVTYEWSYAIAKGIEIIPMLYKSSVDDVHERLREYNIVTASTPNTINFDILQRVFKKSLENYYNQMKLSSRYYDITALKQLLNSDYESEIEIGLRVAIVARDNELRDDLLPLTQHNYFRIRNFALQALMNIDEDNTIEIIINGLVDTNHKVRNFSLSQAKLYARLNSDKWIPILINEIRNEDKYIFVSGVPLGRINAIHIMNHLALMEGYDYEKFSSYFEFGNTLIDLLDNENIDLVAISLKILGKLKYQKIRSMLPDFLEDTRAGYYEENEDGEIIRKELKAIVGKYLRIFKYLNGEQHIFLENAFNRFRLGRNEDQQSSYTDKPDDNSQDLDNVP